MPGREHWRQSHKREVIVPALTELKVQQGDRYKRRCVPMANVNGVREKALGCGESHDDGMWPGLGGGRSEDDTELET